MKKLLAALLILASVFALSVTLVFAEGDEGQPTSTPTITETPADSNGTVTVTAEVVNYVLYLDEYAGLYKGNYEGYTDGYATDSDAELTAFLNNTDGENNTWCWDKNTYTLYLRNFVFRTNGGSGTTHALIIEAMSGNANGNEVTIELIGNNYIETYKGSGNALELNSNVTLKSTVGTGNGTLTLIGIPKAYEFGSNQALTAATDYKLWTGDDKDALNEAIEDDENGDNAKHIKGLLPSATKDIPPCIKIQLTERTTILPTYTATIPLNIAFDEPGTKDMEVSVDIFMPDIPEDKKDTTFTIDGYYVTAGVYGSGTSGAFVLLGTDSSIPLTLALDGGEDVPPEDISPSNLSDESKNFKDFTESDNTAKINITITPTAWNSARSSGTHTGILTFYFAPRGW